MTVDASSNYEHWPSTEVVTVTLKPDDAEPEVKTTVTAKKRALKDSDLLMGGMALTANAAVWYVPVEFMGSDVLQPGDKITDAAAAVWMVQTSELLTFSSKWRAVCQKVGS